MDNEFNLANFSLDDESAIFIGKIIQDELRNQERSVTWLARKLNCDRTNIYNIFKRHSIDSELLLRICVAMNVNFFDYYERMLKIKMSERLWNQLNQ
ncbi:MAG: XRE family transcriptional regulator [Bacteroidales bacterium]|nr:XRE family transcriptional regulator [Bacteroidales bacterium]